LFFQIYLLVSVQKPGIAATHADAAQHVKHESNFYRLSLDLVMSRYWKEKKSIKLLFKKNSGLSCRNCAHRFWCLAIWFC